MITIPANILALIKSRQQIGENRPTAVIEFGGQPGTQNMKDPNVWTTWRTFKSPGVNGNMEETTDKRAVISYLTNGNVYIAFADSVVEVLNGTKTFGPGTSIFNSGTVRYTTLSRIDGKLCLVILYHDAITGYLRAEYWRDSDGNGADFTKVADISTDLSSTGLQPYYNRGMSLVHRLGTNGLAVLVPWYQSTSIWKRVYYSTNDGASWTAGAFLARYYAGTTDSYNFLFTGPESWIVASRTTSNIKTIVHFTNMGADVAYYNWVGDWATAYGWGAPEQMAFADLGGKIYAAFPTSAGRVKIVRFLHDVPTAQNIASVSDWELVADIGLSDDYAKIHMFTLTSDALVFQHTQVGLISGAGTALTPGQKLRPKLVTVSRSKGSASQLSCAFENTNGKYAPDPAGPWNFVMWPNNSIVAKMGYGQYLPQVFAGYPDDVRMETPPQMISITARDRSKLALDQICQWTWDGVTYYDGAWAAQDPEGIFVALATMAGFAAGDIVYDVTGIIIPEFKFSQQTYGDLMQSLAEKSGCEWYCDEVGKIYFKLVEYPAATPAYEFVAGVDIFSLGYTISDAEVYRDVVVTAQDADGNTVSAKATWSAADYYGLPTHKTLLVTASDIVQTEAGCLEIANKLLTAMTTKPRQVDFVATGLPNLQIGDCIKVTEASSTISEIYRVYEFEHQFDAEGSPVFATAIKCYWYAHGEE